VVKEEGNDQGSGMMRFRTIVVALITLSLAIVPASAGAYAAGMASAALLQGSNCSPCPMSHVADTAVDMMSMPLSADCHDIDGKTGSMTPSACAVFCGGLIALPSPSFAMAELVSIKLVSPWTDLTLAGHVDPPEPYPPKR
jgi:hypothetical protein